MAGDQNLLTWLHEYNTILQDTPSTSDCTDVSKTNQRRANMGLSTPKTEVCPSTFKRENDACTSIFSNLSHIKLMLICKFCKCCQPPSLPVGACSNRSLSHDYQENPHVTISTRLLIVRQTCFFVLSISFVRTCGFSPVENLRGDNSLVN